MQKKNKNVFSVTSATISGSLGMISTFSYTISHHSTAYK